MTFAWDSVDLVDKLGPEGRRRVKSQQIDSLFQFPSRLLGHVVNAVLVSAVLWGEIAAPIILVWLGATVAVTFGRMGFCLVYRKSARDPTRVSRWEAIFFAGTLGSALLWGASSFVVWLHPDLSYHAFIAFVVGGTTAAMAMMTYAHLPSLYGFLLLGGFPVAVNLLLKGGGIYLAMAAMVLLFIALAVGHARRAHQILMRSLVLREENIALIDDLSAARDDLEERVRERTGELAEANEILRAEMAAHKETEDRLRQAQKMEAVGQLTGGIAHDFNNLLSVIQGNLELLIRHKIPQEELPRRIDAMMRASRHGAQLTKQLLAFSRRQALHPQAVEVNRLVSSMIEMLQSTLGEAVQIRFVPEGGECKARVDPGQLESAILNLAINARDAMPEGGVLTIATASGEYDLPEDVMQSGEAAKEDASGGKRYVLIAVSDTGTGIPEEVLQKVWEPFFTTKDVGEGSGLGLSMIYGFITQSGGQVDIDSRVGEGTTVKLYIPTYKESKLPPAKRRKYRDQRKAGPPSTPGPQKIASVPAPAPKR